MRLGLEPDQCGQGAERADFRFLFPRRGDQDEARARTSDIWYFIAAFLGVVLIQSWLASSLTPEIPYSEFRTLLSQDKVTDLVIGPNSVSGRYRTPPTDPPDHFVTYRVDPALAQEIATSGAKFTGQPGPGLLASVLGWLLPRDPSQPRPMV